MLMGAWIARSISVVATLGIADLLRDGPKNAQQLASATSAHADSLYRVMRALASGGVFTQGEDGRFGLTPLSKCLRSDAANSLRNAASLYGLPFAWRSWGEMIECVNTGETGFKRAFGLDSPFEYLSKHPDESAIFNAAMTGDITQCRSGYRGRVRVWQIPEDRGCGRRAWKPPYNDLAAPCWSSGGCVRPAARRHRRAAGDRSSGSRRSLRNGGRRYVRIGACGRRRLRDEVHRARVRRAILPDGRLLIVERVVATGNEPSANKLADLQMLVMSGGRERTPREFEEFFAAGGFRLAKIHSTAGFFSIMEGVPA